MQMNLQLIIAVAIGGALGSVSRYVVGVIAGRLLGSAFPWGTLFINIVGSFAIGVLVEIFALRWSASEFTRVFLTIGICGGFTTFSTFSLDAVLLLERGEYAAASAYMVGSMVLAVGGLFGGLHLMRAML
jgi:CrcB protein